MTQQSVLRKSYPRVDAADKVTGRSQYASDVYLTGMLYCKVLKSARSHARILNIDTSKAEQHPGVRAIIIGRTSPTPCTGPAPSRTAGFWRWMRSFTSGTHRGRGSGG